MKPDLQSRFEILTLKKRVLSEQLRKNLEELKAVARELDEFNRQKAGKNETHSRRDETGTQRP